MREARRILIFGLVFSAMSLLIVVYMIPQWGRTEFNGVRLGATTREVAQAWGVGSDDYRSYFQAGLSWYRDGILSDLQYQWVTNLWPPGMVLLNATVIAIVGMDGRFVLALVFVTAMTWSLVLTCGLHVCRSGVQRGIYLAGVLVLFLTNPFSDWIASDYFALPTGFALAFALFALLALRAITPPPSRSRLWPDQREVTRLVVVVGPLLAISLLFRVASLWAIYGVLLTAGAVGVWGIINRVRYRGRSDLSQRILDRRFYNDRFVIRLFLISIVPMITMVSWTYVVSSRAHPDRFSYTITVPELAYGAVWKTDAQLIESGNPWLLESSSNWACRVDEQTCAKIARAEADSPRPYAGVDEYSTNDYTRLAIVGAIKDPLDYLRERAPKAWYHWSSGNAAQGLLFLSTSVAALILAIYRIVREKDLQALVFVSMVLFATIPMITILFYFYYFIPLQVGSVFYLLINQDEIWLILQKRRRSGTRFFKDQRDNQSGRVGASNEFPEAPVSSVSTDADVEAIRSSN